MTTLPSQSPPAETKIPYFAYGSNTLAARLEKRTGKAEKRGSAFLPNHQLKFDKVSDRKSGERSGKCNIKYDPDAPDPVPGVVYMLSPKQFDALNAHEKGYSVIDLEVDVPGIGKILAKVHVSADVDPKAIPYDWYRELILEAIEKTISRRTLQTNISDLFQRQLLTRNTEMRGKHEPCLRNRARPTQAQIYNYDLDGIEVGEIRRKNSASDSFQGSGLVFLGL